MDVLKIVQEKLLKAQQKSIIFDEFVIIFNIYDENNKESEFFCFDTNKAEPKFYQLKAPDECEADCTVYLKQSVFEKLLDKSLSPMVAFSMGRIKITGDLTTAMKLNTLFAS